ncbi:sulfurtransferase [Kribbia dieselivorans]|uniref:sulfurtransferase n=1 Tax=Kribbia dieselivorans TaxID=331526 RepID=UPI000838B1E1|nr:sulfurtransferase [Kribbia dieselivorans]
MTTLPLLVDPTWLADHRDDPRLRIIDATTFLTQPEGDGYYDVASGREAYEREHIPGAVFADLLIDFADQSAPTTFTALDSATFGARIGELGIGDGDQVVIYDQGADMWATRLWWNLRLEGFDDIAILDGGFPAWRAAGLPTATGNETLPAATFTARRRPELLADKQTVLDAIERDDVQLVNSLDGATFAGSRKTYARAGHIPTSSNVFFGNLVNPTGGAKDPEQVRPLFEEAGALADDTEVITYCGSGIAATYLAFQLARLGHDDVKVYDGSMTEWAADDALPLQVSETAR